MHPYMYAFIYFDAFAGSPSTTGSTVAPCCIIFLQSITKCRSLVLVLALLRVLIGMEVRVCVVQGDSLVMFFVQIEEAPPALRNHVHHGENAHKSGELAAPSAAPPGDPRLSSCQSAPPAYSSTSIHWKRSVKKNRSVFLRPFAGSRA